ncbi:ArsR/SmtB family transcription factor [Hugenholtzia roseola]|uniref:ArsR/SmtB family transcription factor n=1 Tax=Hugenholtzia roseola TaxID=1002 RepID=UPI00040F6E2C|nr:winged helix-turn-helix domain-containing protein [Hugenholtzia roseola]
MDIVEKKPYTETDEKIALYAKAIAHPIRVYILRFLEKQCACFAGDISKELPLANSTVSQHLKILKEAGLIQGAINPPTISYCINRKNWNQAQELFNDFFKVKM